MGPGLLGVRKTLELNKCYNLDCMEGMAQFPDGFFDLAVVDPPYGIQRLKRKQSRLAKYGDPTQANNDVPGPDYWRELFRVSRRQIVWGGNYFDLPPCRCFICWYKHQPVVSYSDCEFAWTSMDEPAKCFDYPYFGSVGADQDRIHPTQKPLALYTWIFQHYAKPGEKNLDTHLGSGSSRIAALEAGLDFIGFEIDKTYFAQQEARFERYTSQCSLFR